MTPEEQAALAAKQVPNEGSPEILPIDQKTIDRILSSIDKVAGDAFAARVESTFKDRGALLEKQFERQAATFSALEQYREVGKGQPVVGALFQAAMKAGRQKGTLKDAGGFIHEALGKAVGEGVAKSINIGDAEEGGVFIEGTALELWLEPLRAQSVVLGLNPEIVPVTGPTFKVTGFETDPGIVWVEEENTADLTTTPATGKRETAMRKALMILPVTTDFRESAAPAVLRRLEDLARAAYRVGFDLRYITGTGLSNSITGLRNLISATTATAGTTVAQVTQDFRVAWNSIEANNIPIERLALLWAPRTKNYLMFLLGTSGDTFMFLEEMRRGTFLGVPFGTTTNIPTNLGGGTESYIILQAMNQFFIGQSTALDLQWFQNAMNAVSYTDGGALVSSIERDTEVLRGRMKTATLMPHRTSGHVTTGVTYGA